MAAAAWRGAADGKAERLLEIKPYIGLAGVLIAAITVALNDQVFSIALNDIRGGLGISSDPGTWLDSLYATGQVIGMGLAPSLALAFTIRRFVLAAFMLCMAVTLLMPFCPNLTLLYALRFTQGMAGGFIIPLLLVTGLRVMTPTTRLYALAGYALTATFAPNISATVAALWTDAVNWRFVFFQDLPLFSLAAVLAWYGLPQDPPQYGRLKKFDRVGAVLLVCISISFVTVLEQGDRLDWFNSKLICVLLLVLVLALPLFIFNELQQELPLFGIRLLKRRNFGYALIALFTFLIISQSGSTLPISYLQQVQGFRPAQLYPITLEVALLELIMLPLMAVVLNIAWVDARVVSFIGLICILLADIGDSGITSFWINDSLFLWQGLQTIGQPMFVMALLMIATNTITDPKEGPFASAMINASRALAEPVAVWVTQLIVRWRGGLHYNRVVDQIGQTRYRVIQAQGLLPGNAPPLLPNGQPRAPGALNGLMTAVQAQVTVLTLSDTFLIFGALTVALIAVLLIVPVRTYPPRIVLAQKK